MSLSLINLSELYKVNQYLKKKPYCYDFHEEIFISHDGESDIVIHVENDVVFNGFKPQRRYLYVTNGIELYRMLNGNIRNKTLSINQSGTIELVDKEGNLQAFHLKFTDVIDIPSFSNEELSSLTKIDAQYANMYYNGELIKSNNITIADIIEMLDVKKAIIGNDFFISELNKKHIYLFESRTDLTYQNKTLICSNNLIPLKNGAKETISYLYFYIGSSRLYIHYGNSKLSIIYKFKIFDLNI